MLRIIRCKDEGELDDLCKVLDIFEYRWANGYSLAERTYYLEDILYVIDTETKKVHYVEEGIIEFEKGSEDWWCYHDGQRELNEEVWKRVKGHDGDNEKTNSRR